MKLITDKAKQVDIERGEDFRTKVYIQLQKMIVQVYVFIPTSENDISKTIMQIYDYCNYVNTKISFSRTIPHNFTRLLLGCFQCIPFETIILIGLADFVSERRLPFWVSLEKKDNSNMPTHSNTFVRYSAKINHSLLVCFHAVFVLEFKKAPCQIFQTTQPQNAALPGFFNQTNGSPEDVGGFFGLFSGDVVWYDSHLL